MSKSKVIVGAYGEPVFVGAALIENIPLHDWDNWDKSKENPKVVGVDIDDLMPPFIPKPTGG